MRVAIVGAVVAAVLAAGPSTLAAPGAATTGVVTVHTRLAYSGGAGAGTGVVLTSSGTVLTNNHVIRGAGSIRVRVPSSGRSYTATVAGYSVSKDIALLELRDAQGLATVRTGNSNTVEVGDRVTAVGNGGGGGLTTKSGRVTGLGQSITVSSAGEPFTFVGLIETTTPLRSGDSGGPLLSGGRVIGIDAAASGGFNFRGQRTGVCDPDQQGAEDRRADRRGAALVDRPRRADRVSGRRARARGRRRRGRGRALSSKTSCSGTPADRAGIGTDDLITSFAGKRVSTAASLRKLVLQASPGQTVRVTWIEPSGRKTSAAVRLVAGPPQ